MHKKLTITIEESVYNALHEVIGRSRISQFIEALVKPHVISSDLDSAYREMSLDEEREAEALTWAESTYTDVFNETR